MGSSREIIEKIKNFDWDLRVKRPGFLQGKGIVNEALTVSIDITPHISIRYKNCGWAGDYCLYDNKQTLAFADDFARAFEEEPFWPLRVIQELDDSALKVDALIQELQKDFVSTEQKVTLFLKYVEMLIEVQRFYVLSVPVTNFCELQLQNNQEVLSYFAKPYKKLDIDKINKSKNSEHDYAWLKTGYNIIQKVVFDEEDTKSPAEQEKGTEPCVPDGLKKFITGLQVGIYARNRMKELSQKLWYYVDPLARVMAEDMGISREDFFSMTYSEVLDFYHSGIKADVFGRREAFAIFIIDDQQYIFERSEAEKIINIFDRDTDVHEVKGRIAYKGIVRGKVRNISGTKDFDKFQQGGILITSMTTPEYILLLKKASAIVTDEGGLSCHAAVISRELQIPCVMGTQIATKIFKDGDMVEVDAEKGIVRKI